MGKVVTIPKDRNPFVVIVNGVKHSYPAGVTTEVPDEVADVIEKYEGAKPKPDPNAGSGGSGGGTQSDWNQTDSSAADFIKNKPFVVVNLDFETFSLDKTATEISELTLAGKTVLLGATGTPLSTLVDIDGNLAGVYTNIFSAAPSTSDTFIIVQASTYAFDLDGNFVGIETGTFNVSRDA